MNKETIKEIVENYFEISISRNTRKRQYVEARAIYFKLCREFTQLSLEQIGKSVNRDHASVLHGVKSINTWVQVDKRMNNNMRILKNKIVNYQKEKDETVELNESIVLKYIQLKEQVKWQEEMIQKLNTDLNEITIKHDKREKFYTKYGFIG
tara:strand:+ start:832 stop:1287 length:456 start_codon:yes stop_codon:yes gene_type:complete